MKELKADVPAGLTIGIMLVPQGMAYALIAGLPMVYGLYAALVPQIVYAITGTSRQLAVGPVAMDSLLVAAGLSSIAAIGTGRYIELAIGLALIMGAIQFLLGMLKAGFLVNFLSRPIISGFTSAAALIIGVNQISNLTGLNLPRSTRITEFTSISFDGFHLTTLCVGLIALTVLLLFNKFFPKLPSALIVVSGGILASYFLELGASGISVVGNIPQGLPDFHIPSLSKSDFTDLLPIASTLALIAFMEGYSLAKMVEEKHDYKIDSNQELRALGLSNIIGALFQSYSTTGGFSRTAVNDKAGALTSMSSLVSAGFVGLTLLFLTPVFYHLPKAVLAAIIIFAVSGLIDFKLPLKLWKPHKTEALFLICTFIITASVSITAGIATGVGLSLMLLVYKSMRPHIAELGELSGIYRNITRFSDAKTRDDILIIRFDEAIHFANYKYFQEYIFDMLKQKGGKVKSVILSAESISYIDSSGISALENLISDLAKLNIDFRLAGAIGPVRDILDRSNLISQIGKTRCFASITGAIKDFDSPGSIDSNLRNIAIQSETNL